MISDPFALAWLIISHPLFVIKTIEPTTTKKKEKKKKGQDI